MQRYYIFFIPANVLYLFTPNRINEGVINDERKELRIRRPEGVRRNALRAQRPKSPHFEESAQAQNKTRTSVGHLWDIDGLFGGFL